MLSPAVVERLRRLHQPGTNGSNAPGRKKSIATKHRLPVGREITNESGRHWLVEKQLAVTWSNAGDWIERFSKLENVETRHPELQSLHSMFPQQVVFLDLETCGFAGSMVFLVGLLLCQSDCLVICQLLARDYSEEKAIMQTLWQLTQKRHVLVTFNGKSFDWPVVKDRTTLHRLEITEPASRQNQVESVCSTGNQFPAVHCDLLHHARRRWKDNLPNCKLQTLERYVCGRRRVDDIPGSEIPAAYHEFVRSGDSWPLQSILHHNALDLVTLLELSLRVMQ